MAKQKSMSQRVREMIDRGYTNKVIIEKLGVKPQVVYNLRYQINKERGLGSIGKPAPKPAEGIGAPPKRKVRPKELASIIEAERKQKSALSPEQQRALVKETLRHHPEFLDKPPFAITMIEPEPTVFDKVRERFRNLVRALGGRS